MKAILSERNIVVALFILVFITFSFAHEDTKKMETYIGIKSASVSKLVFGPHFTSPQAAVPVITGAAAE